jgi:hypothetical protein
MTSPFVYLGLLVLILGIGLWLAIRFYKRKKKRVEFEKNPPKEVIDTFEEVERRIKEESNHDRTTGTATNPYKILWEYWRDKGNGANNPNGANNKAVESRELHTKSGGQQDIQDRTTELNQSSSTEHQGVKRNNIRTIFSRFRRTN